MRIDEIGSLIIRDKDDFQTLVLIRSRQSRDGGGFSGSQEATDHDKANRILRAQNLVPVQANMTIKPHSL
jgi:hypothetical protein